MTVIYLDEDQTDSWTDETTVRQTDEWMDGRTGGQIDRQAEGQMDGQLDRWTGCQTDRPNKERQRLERLTVGWTSR